jgi:vesicular inhibitory amino acid transporter
MAEPQRLIAPDEKHEAGVFGTSMNLAVQIMGLGVLQLPYMLRQGGWSCLCIIIACALAANYTGKLLVTCCYGEGHLRSHHSYAGIGIAAFGPLGGFATNVFENATLFGVSSLFLILAGKFLEELVPSTLDTRMWIVVAAALVAVPILLLRSIGELKIISFVGVAAVVATVAAVIVEAAAAGFDSSRPHANTDMFIPTGFSAAFSAMALAFGCHAGLPGVESSMREPSKFGRSFNVAYLVVLLVYVPVAVTGYAIYGNQVYSPILCSLPRDNYVQVMAKALMVAHVLSAYPVLMMLFIAKLENDLGIEPKVRLYCCKRTLFRAAVVASSAAVAAFVPYFNDMMSLIGAVCVVMTAFILPAVFYIRLRAPNVASCIVPAVVAIVGTVGGSIGAVQAMTALIHKVATGADPNDG